MKVTAKRVIRILQALALLLLIVYLAIVRQANPNTIRLPFLLPLPTEWVVALALLLGFLGGWLSLSGRVFRLNRENRGLRQRLIKAGLEAEPQEPADEIAGKAGGRVTGTPDKPPRRKPPT